MKVVGKFSIHVAIVAGVQSDFLLSFVDVSMPMVHCKVLLLSSSKAWLVTLNGLVRYCVYHTTWVLLTNVMSIEL